MITFLFRTTNSSPSFVHKLMKSTTKKAELPSVLSRKYSGQGSTSLVGGSRIEKMDNPPLQKIPDSSCAAKIITRREIVLGCFFLTSIDGFSQISQIHKFSFFKTIHSRLGKRNSVNFHREVGIDKFLKKKKNRILDPATVQQGDH